MEYECPRCDYTTDMKSSMKNHINRKTACKCTKEDICIKDFEEEILTKTYNFNNRKIPCICGLEFASKEEHFEHVMKCKLEFKKLKAENEMLKTQLSKSSNTTNITDNSNNIIFNFNLTPWNDPNLDGAEKYYKQAIKTLFMSIPKIIELIHFNTKLPENHNICIRNYRTKLAKVFTGTEWKTMNEDQLITELVNTYERILEDWAEDNPEHMKHIEKYNEIKERDGRQKVEQEIRDEVKKLIYDKRGMIRIKN